MSTSDSCKDGASKSSDDDVCDVIEKLQNNMSTDDNTVSVCANCGKEGDDVTNTCNKCKQVKYCNAACKKKHRHKHKKDCEEHLRTAAEHVAELHDIELFKQPPPEEDCPICFLRLPTLVLGHSYFACCGKKICGGCAHSPVYDNQGNKVDKHKCPFCRVPSAISKEELHQRYKKRVELGDAIAMFNVGSCYRDGKDGYPQDYTKALELFHRAGESGYASAYSCIAKSYENGRGVGVDNKKAIHYYEQAAMAGSVSARYNLGIKEKNAGNMDRALKHYMIAVRDGLSRSLTEIQELYSSGNATKEDYTEALQSYQVYLGEIKSKQRDKAAADKVCRYY